MRVESDTTIIERRMRHHKRTQGFTLMEAMLAVTVLGFAAAGVLLPFVSGAAVRAEGTRRTLAAGLASDLMEQVLRLPFHDPDGIAYDYSPGPDAGETGLLSFDNMDDFNDYREAEGQVKDAAGVIFTDPKYACLSRCVICEYVTVPPQPAQSDPAKCKFVRVTVEVDCGGRQTAIVSRLVSE